MSKNRLKLAAVYNFLKYFGPSFLLIVFFGVWAMSPLHKPGLYTAHDIWHQVARLYHYSQAVQAGQILPMWISPLAHGAGYPLFIFSYHFPWLIGAPLALLGGTVPFVLKTLFWLSCVASGLTMGWLVYALFKNRLAAVTSAILYVWAPYHFLSIFVSASIGTAFVFTLLPILFLGLYYLTHLEKMRTGVALVALSTAGIILCHFITFVMMMPLAIVWWLVLIGWQRKATMVRVEVQFLGLILALGLGLAITSFYLVPLVHYLPAIRAQETGSGLDALYARNFVYLKQLVYSRWGFGPIVNNAKEGELSFQIGIAQWMGVALSILAGIWVRVKNKNIFGVGIVVASLAGFALTIFSMIDASQSLWWLGARFLSLDYPFRLLVLAVFFGSLVTGWLITALPYRFLAWAMAAGLVVVAVYTNRNHARVNMYTNFPVELYVASEVSTNTFHEYSPLLADVGAIDEDAAWLYPTVTPLNASMSGTAEVASATVSSTLVEQGSDYVILQTNIATPTAMTIKQFGFPDVNLYVDGQPTEYWVDPIGLISFYLEAGDHTLKVGFEKNLLTKVSYGLSLLALGVTLYLLIRPRKSV